MYTNPSRTELISHMPPCRSLWKGVVGPSAGGLYVRFATSAFGYALTENRSEVGASKSMAYGEMRGAKMAMNANTRTIPRPTIARRLSLNRDHVFLAGRSKRLAVPNTRASVPPAGGLDSDTGIQYSVQNVRDDVSEDDEEGDDEEDGAGEEVVVPEHGLEEVVADPEVREHLL